MATQQSSYRQIMKATSIFGGVQVFNIIITIIRSKFVAVLLGPTGMGIAGLLTVTIGIVGSFTDFGLATSAVKNVSAASASANELKVATIVAVVKRLVWITGLLGAFITLLTAPWLSELTFGNKDYTSAFIWLSFTLLLGQLSSGQIIILRGLRKIQYMAKASAIGSAVGLFVSIPIYYVWGLNGIVPAIIISSISSLLLSWYFSSKINLPKVSVDKETINTEGREMLSMGFLLSMSGLITLGASYIIRIFISNLGGVEQVGLYSAGFAIINSYVGMVFSAMGTDYYPRLSAVAHDKGLTNDTINQQAEISILILAPILIIFLVFIQWVIKLLYSTQFIPVSGMVLWAALGIFFKAVSWAIAFIILAKSDSKLFFWNEFITNTYMLGLNLLGYYLGGLDGLGISFLIGYFLYTIQVFFLTKIKYGFKFENSFYKLFGGQLILGVITFVTVKVIPEPLSYIIGTVLILLCMRISYKELDRRLNLKSIIEGVASNFLK